jgi:hypothetical protein
VVSADERLELAGQALDAGKQAFFDDEFAEARGRLEVAFKAFRDARDLRSAARVAAVIAQVHGDVLGNKAAGRG